MLSRSLPLSVPLAACVASSRTRCMTLEPSSSDAALVLSVSRASETFLVNCSRSRSSPRSGMICSAAAGSSDGRLTRRPVATSV